MDRFAMPLTGRRNTAPNNAQALVWCRRASRLSVFARKSISRVDNADPSAAELLQSRAGESQSQDVLAQSKGDL